MGFIFEWIVTICDFCLISKDGPELTIWLVFLFLIKIGALFLGIDFNIHI